MASPSTLKMPIPPMACCAAPTPQCMWPSTRGWPIPAPVKKSSPKANSHPKPTPRRWVAPSPQLLGQPGFPHQSFIVLLPPADKGFIGPDPSSSSPLEPRYEKGGFLFRDAFAVRFGRAVATVLAKLQRFGGFGNLTNAQASQHQPVDFEATVTYYRSYERNLFVQDGDAAIYVHPPVMYQLVPGDRIRVRGTMHESFRPYVEDAKFALLSHGPLPKPDAPQLRADDPRRNGLQARHRTRPSSSPPIWRQIRRRPSRPLNSASLLDGGHADATIDSDNPSPLKDLLDAEVEITGVQSGVFDNKMQQTGILFHVQSLDQVRILKRAAVDPWSIAVTPMDRVLSGYRVRDESDRERVHGTITYYQPGVALVLQDGAKSIWIDDRQLEPSACGLRGRRHRIPSRRKRLPDPYPRRSTRNADAGAGVALALHLASTGPGRQRWPKPRLRPGFSGRPGGDRGAPGHTG